MGAYADLLPDSSDSANTSSSVARSSVNQRVDAFVEQYRPIAERVAEQTGNDAELYLAKWGLETGWGKSIIPGTNNLGNIKDFSGSGVSAKDNATGSVDRYRQYKDANQFADDYASILKRRYKNALNVGSDMDTFATELKRAGYAEDPNYVSKLKSAYNMLGGSAAQSDASQPSPNARGEYEPRTDYSAALRQFDKVPNDTYEANRLASTPKGMSISKEISAAIDSYQANLWSIPAAMGSEYALNAMLENKSAAEQQWADSGAPQSFSEMEFGKNFGQYFAHMAIQSAPYMLEFIASGFGVGSLAKGALANTAKGVAEKAAIEAAKQGATKEAAKKAGEVAAKEFMGTVYTASGVAGSYPSAVGDVLSNQYEQSGKFNLPAAAALGVPYAALNAAGAEGMLTRGLARGLPKTSLTAKGAAGFAGRAALTGAEAGLMEGSTETGQEVMNQLGRMAVDPDAKIDDKRALEAYKESFIAGGLLGGVPGAVAGGFRKPEDAKLQPPAPVANSPLSNAAQAAQAADPITEALKPISERFADRALYEQIRNHPNLGPDAMTQILSAYRVATNSNMDPMARQAAVDRLGEFFRLFDNQPNFTAGKADAPGVPAVVGNKPSAVGPVDPRVGAIDGEASRVAPNQQQGVVTQSAPALATDERARKAAAAEYEAAYQDLVKAEQLGVSDQELMQRQIAMRNAENRLQEINEAIEANRAKETAEKRGALLDRVLASNPGNPNRAFDRALRLEGFRDATFTKEEKEKIARFNELRSIQEDGVFSAPNEAGAFGIREKRPSAVAGRYQHIADMLSSGWQLANKHQLTGPNGEVYNLKGAGEAQFVRNKLNQKAGNGNQSPRGGAQGGTDQGDFGVGGAGANGPLPQGGGNGSGQANALPDTKPADGSVSEAEATGAGSQPNNSLARSRLTALEDPRIAKYADDLRSMAPDAGWAEEGGRLLIAPDGTKSRTKWIPRAEWFIAGMLNSPQESVAAVEKAISGQPMRKAEKLHVQGMMDFLDMQYGIDGESHTEQLATLSDIAYEGESADAQNIIDTLGDVDLESIGAWNDEVESMRALGFTEEEINEITRRKQGAFGAIGEEAAGVPAGETQTAIPEGDGNGNGQAEGQEGFSLDQQTNEEAAAQFAQQQAGESTEITKEQAEEAEARANGSSSARGDAGSALTKEQRKSVLKTLVDVYRKNNAPKEFKGIDNNGNERSGYAYSPEYFVRSDITGAMVRYYVTLPDGRIAHPTELFADYTQSDIDAALQKEIDAARKQEDGDKSRLESLKRRIGETLNVANRKYNAANPNRDDTVPAILTDGNVFIRTAPENVANDLRLLGKGWKEQKQESFNLSKQTNEQAAAEFAQQQAGEPGDITKEQADKERDAVPFSMQMQSQPKPQGTQVGLFTADGRPSVAAKQPESVKRKIFRDNKETGIREVHEVDAQDVAISELPDHQFFVFKDEEKGAYSLTEASTGLRVGIGETAEAAIANFKAALEKVGVETFAQRVADSQKIPGADGANPTGTQPVADSAPSPVNTSMRDMGAKAFADGLPRVAPEGIKGADKVRWLTGYDTAKNGGRERHELPLNEQLEQAERDLETIMAGVEESGYVEDARATDRIARQEKLIKDIKAEIAASQQKTDTSQEPKAIDTKSESDWLGELFGSDSSQMQPVEQNKNKKVDLSGLVGKLREFSDKKLAEANDWASRQYKQNKTKVSFEGDGPTRNESMSISAANESRRNRNVDSLQHQAQMASNLANRIERGFDVQEEIEQAIRNAESDIKRDGKARFGGTRESQIEAYISNSMLGDASYGFGEGTLPSLIRKAYEQSQQKTDEAPKAAEQAAPESQPENDKPAYADDAELQDALSHLGDVLGDVFGAKLNITGKQYGASDLLPAMSKVIELLIKKGFKSFRESVGAATNAMRGNANTKGFVDQITPRQWKAAYNSVAEFHEGTDNEEDVAKYSAEQIQKIIALPEKIKEAEQATNHDATPGQKEAGNYAKGKFAWHGLNIAVETAKGEDRTDKETNGEKWRVTMPATYGYVLGTVGADKDHVDVFMGDKPESQRVYVVNQTKPGSTEFDEHKIMLGYESEGAAIGDYLLSFSDTFGASVLGSVSGPYAIDDFKHMLESNRFSRAKPISDRLAYVNPRVEEKPVEQTAAVNGSEEAKTGDQTYSDIETKLINGEINVEEFMSATGLTDEDVGFLSSNDLREKADIAAKENSPYISGIRKLSEAIHNEMNGLTRGSTAPSRRAYDANVAKYKAAQDTLNVISKNFEHPFRNNLVAKLPPFLESRYGKQWESIEYGDKAKKSYYADSYRKWVDLLIEAARNKQETTAETNAAETVAKFKEKQAERAIVPLDQISVMRNGMLDGKEVEYPQQANEALDEIDGNLRLAEKLLQCLAN